MGQKFYADPRASFTWPNGATGYRPTSGPFDCLGPYAKVTDCPIAGTDLRRTCYATGYADTFFSVPACTRINGRHVAGYFTTRDDGGIEFRAMDRHKDRIPARPAFTHVRDPLTGEEKTLAQHSADLIKEARRT
jgi:hypothetical protein